MPATGTKAAMIFDHARVLDWQDVPATAWNALALGPGAANPFYTRDAVAACVDLPTAQRPRVLQGGNAGGCAAGRDHVRWRSGAARGELKPARPLAGRAAGAA